MTEEMIKEIKNIQQRLVNKEMDGEDWEEKMEMIRKLEERSSRVFSLKEGTLYPILHSLEEQEAVESYEKCADTGRVRKYYHLTKKGRHLLREKQKEWEIYEKAVHDVMKGGMSFAF